MKLSISLPDELVARLDAAKGLAARSAWIAWAVEQALGGETDGGTGKATVSPPAPAEPPERSPVSDVPEPPAVSPVEAVAQIFRETQRSPGQHSPTCKCAMCS